MSAEGIAVPSNGISSGSGYAFIHSMKIGFIGAGNMAQAMIKRLVENKVAAPNHIFVSNRTPGKLLKLQTTLGINVCQSNEEIIDNCDVVILAVKPQDVASAIEPIALSFHDKHIIISLAAGIRMESLQKLVRQGRWVRVMPNTPSMIGQGVVGYLLDEDDSGLVTVTEDLMGCMGVVLPMKDEDQLEALMVACSSGTGFVFEMMMYWQDWLEEHGFETEAARKMTVQTFVGAAVLALQTPAVEVEELQARVTSKKGVTMAGLESMRELEIERALRISFEKAALRNVEIAKSYK
ncbi:MAG: pyrroline-5-carboxylate reductase [Bdellovibrionota bacterium]